MPDASPRKTKAINDGLANVMSGGGTTVDKRTMARWTTPIAVAEQVEAAYRSSWLMRKIVDLPPFDMTREGRDWQAADTQIEALEEVEKKFRIWEKLKLALIMGRLGGGAIILGVNQGSASQPLDYESLSTDSLQYVHVLPYTSLEVGELDMDPDSPNFGEPTEFKLRRKNGTPVPIHADRVITFRGVPSGGISKVTSSDYWGDSVVLGLDEPVQNATVAMNEFASLINEAKIDVFGIPDMLKNVGSAEYEKRLMRRLELANIGKSNHRALVRDAAETWEQRQMNWAGMPDIMRVYLSVVAGAADIPATRLLGKAPDGMNATGDSDQANYFQMIVTKQENELRPAVEKLDKVLIPSALGSTPDEVYWEFAPLKVMSETELATLEKAWADALKVLVDSGLFEDDALEEAFSNRMIESGQWPGYEKARQKALKAAQEEPTPQDIQGTGLPGDPATQPQPGAPPKPGQKPGATGSTPAVTVTVR